MKEKKSASVSVNQRPKGGLLIRGGRVIDPAQSLDAQMDVLLRGGRVAELQAPGKIKPAADTDILDANGLVVAPGFIDLHVHLREPGQAHKESIATGTAAAAAGGFTAVCAMPNTAPINDLPALTRWMQEPERGAVVNVFPVAAATVASQGRELTDYFALAMAGAVGVTDDGNPLADDRIMREALRAAVQANLPVMQHAEDKRLSEGGVMHEGAKSFLLGLHGIPGRAESDMVERDIELAREIGARLHVTHLSVAASLEAVRRGKRAGVQVTCEVTPHHFTLTDDDMVPFETRFKVNPPLRSAADREAVLEGLADGTVDAIATDHAPHAVHEKAVEFDRAPFGLTGLETALGLAITKLHVERKVPLARIVELLSTNPARIIRKQDRGTLAPGAVADVTLFDPNRKWTFEAAKSRSKSHNTPFDGWKLTGKVMATIAGGRVVYRGE
ncbi:MAG: dihydroorotase [Terriglobales bacterium]